MLVVPDSSRRRPRLVKLMTFRYSPTLGGFDDAPLERFAAAREILSLRDHFYTVNQIPHLTCVLTYQEPPVARPQKTEGPAASERPVRPDPSAGLDEEQRRIYSRLRTWRNDLTEEEGAPPYIILTNRQLAAIAANPPESATELGHVDGVGTKKVARHGARILAVLEGLQAASPAAPARNPLRRRTSTSGRNARATPGP